MSDITSASTAADTDHAAAARARIGEAGARLKNAASLAGVTARHAAEAAADELKVGREAVKGELDEAGRASREGQEGRQYTPVVWCRAVDFTLNGWSATGRRLAHYYVNYRTRSCPRPSRNKAGMG